MHGARADAEAAGPRRRVAADLTSARERGGRAGLLQAACARVIRVGDAATARVLAARLEVAAPRGAALLRLAPAARGDDEPARELARATIGAFEDASGSWANAPAALRMKDYEQCCATTGLGARAERLAKVSDGNDCWPSTSERSARPVELRVAYKTPATGGTLRACAAAARAPRAIPAWTGRAAGGNTLRLGGDIQHREPEPAAAGRAQGAQPPPPPPA